MPAAGSVGARLADVQTIHRFSGDDCSVLPVVDEEIPALETLLDRLSIYAQPTSSRFFTIVCRGAACHRSPNV